MSTGRYHVTIAHDALDLTVQTPGPLLQPWTPSEHRPSLYRDASAPNLLPQLHAHPGHGPPPKIWAQPPLDMGPHCTGTPSPW